MNEKEAWNMFLTTGSVRDYLNFKSLQQSKAENNSQKGTKSNEIPNHRPDNQTTEYW